MKEVVKSVNLLNIRYKLPLATIFALAGLARDLGGYCAPAAPVAGSASRFAAAKINVAWQIAAPEIADFFAGDY